MATAERVGGKTQNGGDYSIVIFRDGEGNPTDKNDAAGFDVVEYREDGVEVARTHGFICEVKVARQKRTTRKYFFHPDTPPEVMYQLILGLADESATGA